MSKFLRIVATPLLLLSCALAFAADSFDYHAGNLILLQRKDVQTELKITEAQRTKMNKFADQHRTQLATYQKQLQEQAKKNPKVTPDQKKIMGFFDTLKKNVFAQLSANQLRRLREISLQQAGIMALLDSVVAKKVGMSESQLQRMRTAFENGSKSAEQIQLAAFNPIKTRFEGKKPATQAEKEKLAKEYQAAMVAAGKKITPQMQKIQSETQRNMQAVLTETQIKAYGLLQGKPFKFS